MASPRHSMGLSMLAQVFFEILYILFLIGYSKKKLTLKGLLLTGLFLFILLFGPLTGAISEFGPTEATKLNSPAFTQWRLLSIGRYITRLDFLSIFQWFAGAIVRISIYCFLASKLLPGKQQFNLFFIYTALFCTTIIPWSTITFFNVLHQYYFPLTFIFLSISSILLLILVRVKVGNSHEKSEKKFY